MFDKLIHIKGVGKFTNCIAKRDDWDGVFKKVNAIYADNGSGKTTFTQILRSLSSDVSIAKEIIAKRRSFGDSSLPSISFMDGKHSVVFDGSKWRSNLLDVEVFDTFFVEENVYVISLNQEEPQNARENLKIIVGEDAVRLYNEIIELKKKRSKNTNLRHYLKKLLKEETQLEVRKRLLSRIEESKRQSEKINKEISEKEEEISEITEHSSYLERINNYLSYFCPELQLTKLNRKKNNLLVFNLQINGFEVRSDNEKRSLRHTLSEGEKNALALSFFLARLSLMTNLSKKIVVFDDPLSSLDSTRRHVTIRRLSSLSNAVSQFFLLSHDLNFVKAFAESVPDPLVLQIANDGKTAFFKPYDIKLESLSGIFKDIHVLKDFIDNRSASRYSPRDIVRCIRPILEGFFRIKYFGYVDDTQWLGDFIKRIRDAENGDVFFSQKSNLTELTDINDYAKHYHHSNPEYLEETIVEAELYNYCKRTLALLHEL